MASMSSFVRGKVSKSKRRYVDRANGFDLDLSYITKNIIATGFPSEGLEAKYRNPYSEVIRLLDMKHRDHFKLYNLCSERDYDSEKFYNRVGRFPFDDHNAPPFDMIEDFCEDVRRYLAEDERNVAVIHCKAGKGRTGTMICAYLLYSEEWSTAEDSMNFYAAMRTYNRKGVTIPSQIRYIYYFEKYLKHGMPPLSTLLLSRVVFSAQPHFQGEIRFQIMTVNKQELFTYKPQHSDKPKPKAAKKKGEGEDNAESVAFECGGVPVLGDIKVEVFDKIKSTLNPMFQFWFNTGFVSEGFGNEPPYRVVFQQSELDKANKDKNHKIYPQGFHVILEFQFLEGSSPSPSSSSSSAPTHLSVRQSMRSSIVDDTPLVCPDAAPPRGFSDLMTQYITLENL